MTCGGYICIRNALALFNVIFVAVALSLMTAAAYAKVVAYITVLPVIGAVFVCGVCLLFVAIIGIYGTVRQHQVLLFFYALLLVVMFIVQLTVGIICIGLSSELKNGVLKQSWEGADELLKVRTQDQFVCCGFNAGTQNTLHGAVGHPLCNTPALTLSCCGPLGQNVTCCHGYQHNDTNYANDGDYSDQCQCPSCLEKINPLIDEAIVLIGVVCILFSFTELIAAWLTIKYRNLKNPHKNPSLFV